NVTIFVSTHFMNEAARCDRISLMNGGRVLATDTPANLIKSRGAATLEEAFISYLEESAAMQSSPPSPGKRAIEASTSDHSRPGQTPISQRRARFVSLGRAWAYSRREALELLRDPIRMSFAFLGTAFLMIIFGFGVTTDVDTLSFAALDRDQTPQSRAYLAEL